MSKSEDAAIDLALEREFELGGLRVSPSSREVFSGRDRKTVEPRVMQALICLARAQGAVVSRDELIQRCWGGRIVGEDAINRCIAKARRLAGDGQHFTIETIARVGYRLSVAEGYGSPAEAADVSLFERMLASSGLHGLADVRADLVSLLTNQEAHSEQATILFGDMKGFGRLTQILAGNPQAIHEHLAEFSRLLASSILSHNGILNRFIGDSVLALFRGPDGPLHAVQCAFDIRMKFVSLKEKWSKGVSEELDFLDVAAGIAYGDVTIGRIGDDKVSDFTIIGNAVTLAAAIEREAHDGRLILCEKRAFHAVEPWVIESEGPLKLVSLGGKGTSYQIFHITSLRPNSSS